MVRPAVGVLLATLLSISSYAQDLANEEAIHTLINQYAKAREQQDTVLLKRILTKEIDQLVSSGEWRRGIDKAKEGMMRSSHRNPGERTLEVETVRFMTDATAIADARYVIKNANGSVRKMWSTFVVMREENTWKIAAIRNMLPSK